MSASHYNLSNLIAIVDVNGMGLDGPMDEVMNIEPIADKFASFGWSADEINGHDMSAVTAAFTRALSSDKPHVIVARTKKGKGVSFMETSPYWHLGYLGPADKEVAIREIEERMGQ